MLFGTLAATGQVARAQANSQTTGTASTLTPEPSGVTPHVVATDPSEAPSGAVVQLFVQPKTALDGGNTRVFLDEDEARIVDAEPGWLTVIVPAKNPKGGREITRIFLEVQGKRGDPYEKFSVISPKVLQRPDLPWSIAGIEPSAPPGWPTNVRFTSDIPVEYWGNPVISRKSVPTQVLFNNTPAKILSMKPGVFRVEVPLDLGTTQPDIVLEVSDIRSAPYREFRIAPEAPSPTPVSSPSPSSSRVWIWIATAPVAAVLVFIGAYFVYARRRRKDLVRAREEDEARQKEYEVEQAVAREQYAKEIAELKLALDERTRLKSSGALVLDETAKGQESEEAGTRLEKSIVDGFVPAPPEDLVEVCASGECVLFAGGGIGAQAGYPIWGIGLARLLEMAAEPNPSAAWDSLRTALTNGDLSLVAELIRSRLAEGELLAMVKATFKTESNSLPAVHLAFRNIPFLGVMTPNWDNLLDETFSSKQPERLSPRDTTPFLELTRQIRFFLLQLYGDPSQPESFIFTPAEYLKNIFENEAFGKFIAFLFQAKTFFFAGASLAGIEDFLSGLRLRAAPNRRHFALVPWQSDIDIQSERFESQYGVELLVYGPTADFPEVPRFVEELRDRVRNKGTRAAKPEIEAAKLESVTLENIGPFESLTLSFEQPWNVLLGNNGSGKSTLLKAIALGLCGDDPKAAEAGVDLLRSNSAKGAIVLRIGGTDFTTTLSREGEKVTVRSSVTPLQAGRWAVLGFPPLRGASLQNPRGPSQGATTAHPDVKDLLPLVHGQVDYRMDSVKQWLVNVHTWSQPDKPEEAQDSARYAALRDAFFKILGALTPGVSVAFAGIAKGTFQIMVQTQDGIVPIDLVSQGTSSVFGWIGALLQRMYEIYGDQPGVEAKPALVLVDEIDAHMHPDWQRKIVPLIKSIFPNLQVFATTHSPLIIGSMEKNEIYHLRRSEGIVSVERLTFSPKGWRADQILSSAGDPDYKIPQNAWNRINNYYPGDEYVDWIGLSVYGAQKPEEGQECPSFCSLMDNALQEFGDLKDRKPLFILEFGATGGLSKPAQNQDNCVSQQCNAADWAADALTKLLGNHWPEVRGFSWWNETWLDKGDNHKQTTYKTDMRVQCVPRLKEAFQRLRNNQSLVTRPLYRKMDPKSASMTKQMRLLVPAYFYPNGSGAALWERMIKVGETEQLVVIANPNSGPGQTDATYQKILSRASASGLRVLGYIATGYGGVSLSQIKSNIDKWLKLYPTIQGFFFDEQEPKEKNDKGDMIAYYSKAFSEARNAISKTKCKSLIISNPGTECSERYLTEANADVLCLYERSDKPEPDDGKRFSSFHVPWMKKYPADKFAVLIDQVASKDLMKQYVQVAREKGFGYVFITNEPGRDPDGAYCATCEKEGNPTNQCQANCNPWDKLPPETYWEDELRSIGALS